jgi:hypothetical protein
MLLPLREPVGPEVVPSVQANVVGVDISDLVANEDNVVPESLIDLGPAPIIKLFEVRSPLATTSPPAALIFESTSSLL